MIHGAGNAIAKFGSGDADPRTMIAINIEGTNKIRELAAMSCARVLFVSSSAVCGVRTEPVDELVPCHTARFAADAGRHSRRALPRTATCCVPRTRGAEVDRGLFPRTALNDTLRETYASYDARRQILSDPPLWSPRTFGAV